MGIILKALIKYVNHIETICLLNRALFFIVRFRF